MREGLKQESLSKSGLHEIGNRHIRLLFTHQESYFDSAPILLFIFSIKKVAIYHLQPVHKVIKSASHQPTTLLLQVFRIYPNKGRDER